MSTDGGIFDFLCTGKAFAEAQIKELKELERIKQAKIEELTKAGVPEKYLAELSRKKFAVSR
jgi:hypothetical protein